MMTAFKIIVLWTELSILVGLFIAPMFAFNDRARYSETVFLMPHPKMPHVPKTRVLPKMPTIP
jgi:hypothetical protein